MRIAFINNIGFILLAIYLILQGLNLIIAKLALPRVVLGVFALLAGIFIIVGM